MRGDSAGNTIEIDSETASQQSIDQSDNNTPIKKEPGLEDEDYSDNQFQDNRDQDQNRESSVMSDLTEYRTQDIDGNFDHLMTTATDDEPDSENDQDDDIIPSSFPPESSNAVKPMRRRERKHWSQILPPSSKPQREPTASAKQMSLSVCML